MTASGRRAADPAFPRALRLLGHVRPLSADVRLPYALRRRALAALGSAAAKLEADASAGRLSAADRAFLAALTAFMLGPGRSGQWRGTFILGLADLRTGADAAYWASALVHDGVHAWRQARGRRWRDEVGPCEAQIAYLQRSGADPALIAHVTHFRDSLAGQRRRRAERV
jgi:hypothetical protein